MSSKSLFLFLFCLIFYCVINSHASFEVRWVGELNTEWHDGTPFVTTNGQTMYFSSGREGGFGNHDIYRATLSGDIWVNITNITELNTSGNDVSPWIVGNYMYFSTDRWTGDYEIARATLNGGVWGNIVPLPGFVQTGVNACCSFTADGNTMYFCSNRQPSMGSFDIFKATNVGGNWVVTNLGPPVDTVAQEGGPSISPDGTVLHFCKMNRIGTWFLYVSKWNGSSWSVPELLPPPINVHPWQNETPCYRPEQNILWFVSDRTGSLGGHDIWKASNYRVVVEPTSLGFIKASFHQ